MRYYALCTDGLLCFLLLLFTAVSLRKWKQVYLGNDHSCGMEAEEEQTWSLGWDQTSKEQTECSMCLCFISNLWLIKQFHLCCQRVKATTQGWQEKQQINLTKAFQSEQQINSHLPHPPTRGPVRSRHHWWSASWWWNPSCTLCWESPRSCRRATLATKTASYWMDVTHKPPQQFNATLQPAITNNLILIVNQVAVCNINDHPKLQLYGYLAAFNSLFWFSGPQIHGIVASHWFPPILDTDWLQLFLANKHL